MPPPTSALNNLLLNRLRKEETAAFEELYRDYYHYCSAVVRNNNGSKTDAQDLFQEATIVLLKKIRSDNFELTCSIKVYLFSICRNLWLKKLRGKRKMSFVEEPEKEWIDLPDTNEDEQIEFETLQLIEEKLNEIGEICKRILTSYFYQGLTLDEIAQILGLKDRRFSGMRKMRCLEKLIKAIKESGFSYP